MARTLLVRRPDWRERLLAYCIATENEPFVYGKSDCATFAAGAVASMTGEDVLGEFASAYTNRFGALRKLLKTGHRSIVSAVEARANDLGWQPITEDQSSVGDIAVVPGVPLHSLTIRVDGGYLGRSPTGLALMPLGTAIRIWEVPDVQG